MIPGWIIAMATFPGIIMHEAAHRFFCDICGVRVYEVCYFDIRSGGGYVLHDEMRDVQKALLISMGPLLINTVVCAVLTWPISFAAYLQLESGAEHWSMWVLGWIGISAGANAFPSSADIDGFMYVIDRQSKRGAVSLVWYLVAIPFSWVLRLANILRFVWFDFIYAAWISLVLPALILAL